MIHNVLKPFRYCGGNAVNHTSNRLMTNVVLLLFFLSGATGLAYEIVWTRQLGILLGNTTFVISMVLAAFMGGLAAGSLVLGRWSDLRTDYLRIYGTLEIAIAVYCFCLPWLIDLTVPLFRAIYVSTGRNSMLLQAARASVAWLILLMPSFLMGGTLPVLAKFVARSPRTYGEDVGVLNAANTLGAVVAALGTGFYLIPKFGVRTTLYGATLVTLLVGIASIVLQQRADAARSREHAQRTYPERSSSPVEAENRAFLVAATAFAVSGFAAMAYEVVWTRLLALFVGPSTYAFTIVVAAFICGLAFGSALFGKYAATFKNVLLVVAGVQIAVGVAMMVLMNMIGLVYGSIEQIMNLLPEKLLVLYLAQFLIFYALLLVPTVLSGGVFPLVCQSLGAPKEWLGKAVGSLYAWNSVGAVAGSLSAGFVMIPKLGIRGSLRAIIIVNIILGGLLAWYVLVRRPVSSSDRRRAGVLVFAVIPCLFLTLVLPGWQRTLLIYPPYIVVGRRLPDPQRGTDQRILHYEEGVNATVAVLDGRGVRTLSIEGKPDASAWSPEWKNALWMPSDDSARGTDMLTQVVVGHLPIFCARNRQDVLVIGLASGVTVGSVEQHPDVRSIVCAEIAPEMYRATHYFDYVNHNVLSDPRLTVLFEDGRNHLLMNRNRYDVIISEPSNPWMPGAAKLFTREAFQAASESLKQGGLMCTWVQSYSMQPDLMRSIIRSFSDIFPYVTMFRIAAVDYCLIGTHYPQRLNESELAQRFAIPSVREDVERVSVTDWTELARMCVATTSSLREAVRDEIPNTDDNSRVEFLSPLALMSDTINANQAWISRCEVNIEELFDESVSASTIEMFKQRCAGTQLSVPQSTMERWKRMVTGEKGGP